MRKNTAICLNACLRPIPGIMRINRIILLISSLPSLCTALSSLQSPPAFWNGGIPAAAASANTNSPAHTAEVKVAGEEHSQNFWNGGIAPPAAIHSSDGQQQAKANGRITNPRYPDLPLDRYLANPYFHRINVLYPNLQLIHEEPYIFIVNNFLTDDECDRLIQKATSPSDTSRSKLRQQIGGGSVVRSSTGIVCENEEVPTIRQKMCELTNVDDVRQLQPLKVTQYVEGQTFSKHTDAWPTEGAPISRGWVNEHDFFGDEARPVIGCVSSNNKPLHNNYMTCLVYLNDIPSGRGGCTTFPNIGIHESSGLSRNFYQEPTPMDSRLRPDGSPWDWSYGKTLAIHPSKGMALLHFPSLLPEYGGLCDGNTFHQAEKPDTGYEKFVCQQFFSSCNEWSLPEESMPIGRVCSDTI